ncbi:MULTISPECIES: DUF1801 domain-containing protein [Falsihalocynthiibacter]|uniref:DUF1801 domain-containing protein n=1 Tax=Falsihalocynthiibacter TaxID=2854182 RepID=UPI003003969A
MTQIDPTISDKAVAAVFAGFPRPARDGTLLLRSIIFEIADRDERVGGVSETLKWGQPSYLPIAKNVGTPIRLGVPKAGGFALFVHCQTTVISEFRTLFSGDFEFDGNRAVLFDSKEGIEIEKITLLINRALTYKL